MRTTSLGGSRSLWKGWTLRHTDNEFVRRLAVRSRGGNGTTRRSKRYTELKIARDKVEEENGLEGQEGLVFLPRLRTNDCGRSQRM